MANRMNVPDRAVLQNDPVVDFEIAFLAVRSLYCFPKRSLILGVHAAQNGFGREFRRLRIESKNPGIFAAKVDTSLRHAPRPTSGMAEPLPFLQVRLAS